MAQAAGRLSLKLQSCLFLRASADYRLFRRFGVDMQAGNRLFFCRWRPISWQACAGARIPAPLTEWDDRPGAALQPDSRQV